MCIATCFQIGRVANLRQPFGQQRRVKTSPRQRTNNRVQRQSVGLCIASRAAEGVVGGNRLGQGSAFVRKQIQMIIRRIVQPARVVVYQFSLIQPIGHQRRALVFGHVPARLVACFQQGHIQQAFHQRVGLQQI